MEEIVNISDLRKFTNLNEFLEYAESKKSTLSAYLSELSFADCRTRVAECLFQNTGIEIKDKSFLELGPGAGEAMKVALARGANRIEFVDNNPYVVRYLELLGFTGYECDYYKKLKINKKYHMILSKGSINADCSFSKDRLKEFIIELHDLLEENGHMFVCPTFLQGESTYVPSEGKDFFYVCSNPGEFRRSFFFKTFIQFGFKPIVISGFNHPPELFPFTFYKGNLEFDQLQSDKLLLPCGPCRPNLLQFQLVKKIEY